MRENTSLNGAVLDVNLGGDQVLPVADKLLVQGVPFLFVTAYYSQGMPASYRHITRLEKPAEPRAVVRALAQMLKAT